MRKIIVLSMISLDGVMQAPGGPEEDTSGGFEHGGWARNYSDEPGSAEVRKELAQATDYLLGRKTFDIWEPYWPAHAAIWPAINSGTKYVLSRTLKHSDWENSVFIDGVEKIKELKNSDGPDLQVWGSSQLVQLLFDHDLVDELRLKIYPLILGEGKKLFANGTVPIKFKLVQCIATPGGQVLANYAKA
jgi:dihydrofolate reductase